MWPLALWWLWAQALGLAALPLAFSLFRNLPDRGYAFSKALGFLFLGYLLWLSGLLHILPNSRFSILLLLGLLAGLSGFLGRRQVRELRAFFRANLFYILAAEAVFAAFFLAMAALRAYAPDIYHTEQPMDFAFLNGVYRSRYFPPLDPWLSGHSISYYYFGYLLVAMMSHLSGIPPAMAYNLALALFFALAALGAFGLAYNLVLGEKVPQDFFTRFTPPLRGGGAALGFGLVGAGFVLVLGNLEGGLEMLYARGWGSPGLWDWLGIKGLEAPYVSAQWYPTEHWWWWRATRILDGGDTITEFPFFSFLLGDLHPHLMAYPLTMVALGLGFNTFLSASSPGLAWLRHHLPHFLALALVLGSLAFLNSWDLPTYMALFLGLAFLRAYLNHRGSLSSLAKDFVPFSAILLATSILFYLPFYLSFRSQASGALPVVEQGGELFQLFLLWGPFLYLSVSFLGIQAGALRQAGGLPRRLFLTSAYPFLGLLALWLVTSTIYIAVEDKGGAMDILKKLGQVLPWLALLSLALALLRGRLRLAREGWEEGGSFLVLACLFLAFFIIFGAELFFVVDVFGNRMNTVFKFYYQAWLLLALASAAGLYYIGQALRGASGGWGRRLWWGGLALLLGASLAYPVAAPLDKTGAFAGPPTWNGLSYLEKSESEEYKAIRWLNDNVKGTPVILEAPGREWEPSSARVATNTGLPTVLGWPGHERQWRGSWEPLGGRERDIDLIYQTLDTEVVLGLLRRYNVSYVYVGRQERERYGPDLSGLAKFDAFLEVAYSGGLVTIYRVP